MAAALGAASAAKMLSAKLAATSRGTIARLTVSLALNREGGAVTGRAHTAIKTFFKEDHCESRGAHGVQNKKTRRISYVVSSATKLELKEKVRIVGKPVIQFVVEKAIALSLTTRRHYGAGISAGTARP